MQVTTSGAITKAGKQSVTSLGGVFIVFAAIMAAALATLAVEVLVNRPERPANGCLRAANVWFGRLYPAAAATAAATAPAPADAKAIPVAAAAVPKPA